MIKENTEPKDDQILSSPTAAAAVTAAAAAAAITSTTGSTHVPMTSPTSTINHTVQQHANNNYKWKQISLQGLDLSAQSSNVVLPSKISTPPLNSGVQRVSRHRLTMTTNRVQHVLICLKSIRRTATVLQPNAILVSSTGNDPRRTLPCTDMTLPVHTNQNNTFFRRRTQQHVPLSNVNGQSSDKSISSSSSSSCTKSSMFDDPSNKTMPNTFSLLRQHSSPTTTHNHKSDKSAYDNLPNATLPIENTLSSSTNLERKSSFPLNRKSTRHATNDSLVSDAYDNYPDRNGYDNYPIRKTNTATSMMMTTSQNDADGTRTLLETDLCDNAAMLFIDLDRQTSSTMNVARNEFNTKRSQSINLKTPFTLKSTLTTGTMGNDENKRSGSAHHRTTKASSINKESLCNLNAASCSPLNEHVSEIM
jgi:hypothetical protein